MATLSAKIASFSDMSRAALSGQSVDPFLSSAPQARRDSETQSTSSENSMAITGTKRPRESDDEDEEICRYCFSGVEDGELITPCDCRGGQKYVHLECLRFP